jgi:RNA polymerase sigma-70 factor (ECF subfamily)
MTAQAIAMSDAAAAPQATAEERLGQLFDAHHARLYSLARRMTRSAEEARDAVQETFLRAARFPASIPAGPSQEEAWLVRVLINIQRDEWRKLAVRRRHQIAPPPRIDRGDVESALVARSTIRQALDALPPRRRAILVMYEIEGATIPAIAAMLGVRAVTVRWHLSIGRRELARRVGSAS